MNLLLIAPNLGFDQSDHLAPGGLSQFGRCVTRAMATMSIVNKMSVWAQVDSPEVEDNIKRMLQVYAHPQLNLTVRCFGGSKLKLGTAMISAILSRQYQLVMYVLVNQAELTLLPMHPPYIVWEIGRELYQTTSWTKRRVLRNAERLLSISNHTAQQAVIHNNLPLAKVIHLCTEPPLYELELVTDDLNTSNYDPASRDCSVLIVSNMIKGFLYKGHRQIIEGWREVVENCPNAMLWIVGDGDGRSELEQLVKSHPEHVSKRIKFWGQVDDETLKQMYRRCRVFAMPSTGEGFGLVFVEAARYGVPCIAGKYDAVKEIVVDNETGFLIEQHAHDIAIACIRLLTDDELAKRLGEAGHQRYMSNYRFEHFRQRLVQAIESEFIPDSSKIFSNLPVASESIHVK